MSTMDHNTRLALCITAGIFIWIGVIAAACRDTTPHPPWYRSCVEVSAAGKAPLRTGDPGYSTRLDRDRDGVACDE